MSHYETIEKQLQNTSDLIKLLTPNSMKSDIDRLEKNIELIKDKRKTLEKINIFSSLEALYFEKFDIALDSLIEMLLEQGTLQHTHNYYLPKWQ